MTRNHLLLQQQPRTSRPGAWQQDPTRATSLSTTPVGTMARAVRPCKTATKWSPWPLPFSTSVSLHSWGTYCASVLRMADALFGYHILMAIHVLTQNSNRHPERQPQPQHPLRQADRGHHQRPQDRRHGRGPVRGLRRPRRRPHVVVVPGPGPWRARGREDQGDLALPQLRKGKRKNNRRTGLWLLVFFWGGGRGRFLLPSM